MHNTYASRLDYPIEEKCKYINNKQQIIWKMGLPDFKSTLALDGKENKKGTDRPD